MARRSRIQLALWDLYCRAPEALASNAWTTILDDEPRIFYFGRGGKGEENAAI
jgi:hypothetical protein